MYDQDFFFFEKKKKKIGMTHTSIPFHAFAVGLQVLALVGPVGGGVLLPVLAGAPASASGSSGTSRGSMRFAGELAWVVALVHHVLHVPSPQLLPTDPPRVNPCPAAADLL